MKITAGATLQRFADLFDVPIEEVVAWVNGYVNHPDREAPEQVKRGEVEATEKERFASIASYIKLRIENTADSRIKASIAQERAEMKEAA